MPKAKATKKAMPDISKLTIPKLKALCKEMLIPCPGNKPEIIRAILDARAKKVTSPIKIASPKPSPKKVGSSPKNYEKMTLAALRKLCLQKHGLNAKECKLSKKEVVAFLKAAGQPIKIPSPAKSPGKIELCFESDGSKKCGTDICDVNTGKCVKLTKKTKKPFGEKKYQTAYGSDYYYDEKHGVLGRKEDVMSFISKMGGKKVKSPQKSPKAAPPKSPKKVAGKKKKARCDDKTDFLACGDQEVCSTKSGRCVADKAANRKGKWQLLVDGRTIVGTEDTIKELQKALGGEMRKADEKAKKASPARVVAASPKREKSPKKAPSPKDIAGIEARMGELLGGGGTNEEMKKLKKRLEELKKTAGDKKSPQKKKSPAKITGPDVVLRSPPKGRKIDQSVQSVYDSFSACLANLK